MCLKNWYSKTQLFCLQNFTIFNKSSEDTKRPCGDLFKVQCPWSPMQMLLWQPACSEGPTPDTASMAVLDWAVLLKEMVPHLLKNKLLYINMTSLFYHQSYCKTIVFNDKYNSQILNAILSFNLPGWLISICVWEFLLSTQKQMYSHLIRKFFSLTQMDSPCRQLWKQL